MSAQADADERNVVPVWRPAARSSEAGEFTPAAVAQRTADLRQLDEPAAAFIARPGYHTALDLLAAAEMLGVSNVSVETAQQVVEAERAREKSTSEPSHTFAFQRRQAVRSARERLRSDPRDVLTWVDASLAYTTLGQTAPATRAMEIALSLAPENRFVLRAASRLFIHVGDALRAFELLGASSAHREDPWVAASYLASAEVAQKPVGRMRAARELLINEALSDRSRAELASQIGTMELRDGQDRKGRHLIRQSLRDPNGNVLAQAAAVLPADETGQSKFLVDATPLAHEANARLSAHALDFESLIRASQLWHADESFSARPAVFASWAAGVFDRGFETADEMLAHAMAVNPHDLMLLNNAAFVDIQLGRYSRAAEKLGRSEPTGNSIEEGSITATAGMLAFRLGETARGRDLYRHALRQLAADHTGYSIELASLYWVLEERRVADAGPLPEEIENAIEKSLASPVPELRMLASRAAEPM